MASRRRKLLWKEEEKEEENKRKRSEKEERKRFMYRCRVVGNASGAHDCLEGVRYRCNGKVMAPGKLRILVVRLCLPKSMKRQINNDSLPVQEEGVAEGSE